MQKPIEWVIATKLERLYSKEEILLMYLNQFDFLYNAVGIQSASQVYFSTTPTKLKIEEAAMLVGMCKNPSLYNPMRYPERAIGRRNKRIRRIAMRAVVTVIGKDKKGIIAKISGFFAEKGANILDISQDICRAEDKKKHRTNPVLPFVF